MTEWIRVEDRLPNDGADVLAYVHRGEETSIVPVNYYNGTWYDCLFNKEINGNVEWVSHWCGVEPPKD